MPPEINTSRLMAGAGPVPMLQAAAGWEAFAVSLETQADELAASLSALASSWTGAASDRAVSATMPMVLWLRMLALQAQKRALQAGAQADSYTLAMATTPPLGEIADNHVDHFILESTNFLGVNAMPIAINEADYLRMWELAAAVMDAYQAETTLNTVFEPIAPMTPIVIPGVGDAAASAAMGQVSTMAAGSVVREAVFAQVAAGATVESVGLETGRAAGQATMVATRAEGQVERTQSAASQPGRQPQQGMPGAQQGVQMATQVASQLGPTLGQLPQQAGQLVSQPMQQLTQPLQQVTSMFSQMGLGSSERAPQLGLVGAGPFSEHPLAGGSGASTGAGLVRAASLPGAGGTSARTPLMSNLIAKELPATSGPSAAMAEAAAGTSAAGVAPVGTGGGAGPMGMAGHGTKAGGTRTALKAPAPLRQDLGEDDGDDW